MCGPTSIALEWGPLETSRWLAGQVGRLEDERMVLAGTGAGPLAAILGHRARLVLLRSGRGTLPRGTERSTAGVRAAPDRWPLRGASADLVVVFGDHRLAATAPGLARSLRPDGQAFVGVRREGHGREFDELVQEASGVRLEPAPAMSVADATAAVAPWLLIEGVEYLRGQLAARDVSAVNRAVQDLRPEIAPRLSGFTNWTMVMARVGELAARATRAEGGWAVSTDVAVLRGRRGAR